MKYLLLGTLAILPSFAFAQQAGGVIRTIGDLSVQVLELINSVLVPLVFAIAFLVFIWGLFKFFIAKGAEDESRKQGKQLMVWGLVAFFVMVSVWGLVNILVRTFNLDASIPALPTVPTAGGSAGSGGGGVIRGGGGSSGGGFHVDPNIGNSAFPLPGNANSGGASDPGPGVLRTQPFNPNPDVTDPGPGVLRSPSF